MSLRVLGCFGRIPEYMRGLHHRKEHHQVSLQKHIKLDLMRAWVTSRSCQVIGRFNAQAQEGTRLCNGRVYVSGSRRILEPGRLGSMLNLEVDPVPNSPFTEGPSIN